MTDTIPEAVIEAMEAAITWQTTLDAGNPDIGRPPGVLLVVASRQHVLAALKAAEGKGYRLYSEDEIEAIRRAAYDEGWGACCECSRED